MKNLLFTILAVAFTSVVYAQQAHSADSKVTQASSANDPHCYTLKNGVMMVCFGTKEAPMTASVTLANGIIVTYTGQIVAVDGTEIPFGEGKCIELNGKVHDYSSMHPDNK